MALEVKITVALSSDKESVTITDNGTNWGIGGNIGIGDVTSITAKVYKRNSTTADHDVDFTVGEIATYVGDGDVLIDFTDERWFGETYAPDEFYTVQLYINETYTSDSGYFSLILTLEQLVHKNSSTVAIRPDGLVKSQQIAGSIVELDTLKRLDASTDVTRKYRWGIIYDAAYANITKFY